MRKFLFLNSAQRFSDFTLLLLRVFIGAILVWEMWTQISDAEHMQGYVGSLALHGFPASSILGPFIAYLHVAIGAGLIVGLFTRWAGILCSVLYAVAIFTIHRGDGLLGVFPSACLFFVGLYLGTHGAGRFSLDAKLGANDLPRSNGGVRFKV